MNILDKVIAPFSPQRALSRAVARKKLEAINNLGYDRHGASTHKNRCVDGSAEQVHRTMTLQKPRETA